MDMALERRLRVKSATHSTTSRIASHIHYIADANYMLLQLINFIMISIVSIMKPILCDLEALWQRALYTLL